MPHISFSELKDWVTCAFYHKLTRVDKLKGFKGNEYTAFGTAIHAVCEKKLLKEKTDEAKIKELMKDKFILQEEKNLVYSTFETDEELRSRLLLSAASSGYPISDREIDAIIKKIGRASCRERV